VAVFWFIIGLILLGMSSADHFGWLSDSPVGIGGQREYAPLAMFISSFYVVIPLGVFFRTKWGFYGALLLSIQLLLALPIGTIFGIMTIRSLGASKDAFGVR
jgi:hypothetical protein